MRTAHCAPWGTWFGSALTTTAKFVPLIDLPDFVRALVVDYETVLLQGWGVISGGEVEGCVYVYIYIYIYIYMYVYIYTYIYIYTCTP